MSTLLREELKQVTKATTHLQQSNAELREEHAKSPDPEYKQAIEENIVFIAKYRARAACLIEEIAKIEGIEPEAVLATGSGSPQLSGEAQQGLHQASAGPARMDLDGTGGGSSSTGEGAGVPAQQELSAEDVETVAEQRQSPAPEPCANAHEAQQQQQQQAGAEGMWL